MESSMKFFTKLFFVFLLTNSSFFLIAEDDEVEEVIVTATSRETSVLDVPYNISTISGDEIQNRSLIDNAELLRGFAGISTIDRGQRNAGTISNIRIRGLNVDSGALSDYPVSAAASVSTYVDKTPVFANFLLKDLNRVEVLRGPQGTLYGSGALGGTIRYITNKPLIEVFEGSVNYTRTSVDGSDSKGDSADIIFNFPIGSKAAYRMTASKADYPGITDYVNVHEIGNIPAIGSADASYGVPIAKGGNGFPSFISSPPVISPVNDADTVEITFTRHKFLFDISDHIELILSSTNQKDDVGGRRHSSTGTKYILNSSCDSLLETNCYTQSEYGEYENGALMLEPSEREVSLRSGELSVDLNKFDVLISKSKHKTEGSSTTDNTGFFAQNSTLTSPIAGYWNTALGGIWAGAARPYTPADRQYGTRGDTLEIKIISEPGDLYDFVLGYFKQDESMYRNQQTYIKGTNLYKYYYWGVDYIIDSNEQDFDYNVYEEITNKAFFGELTFHLKNNIDLTIGARDYRTIANANMDMSFKLYNVGPASDSKSNIDEGTLSKINLSYKPNESQNFFITLSDGYRRGGVNAVPTSGTFIEDSGWVPFSSDTVTNLEFGVKGSFQNNNKYNISFYSIDWKDPQVNAATPNYGYYAVINGEKAQTNGMDLELSGSRGPVDWNLGYAYNNSELKQDIYSPADSPVLYAEAGAKLPGSPEHTLNLNLAHTQYLKSGIGLVYRLDYYQQSETTNFIGVDEAFSADFKKFSIVNISATLFKDDMYVSLFIKNLGNDRGVTGAFLNQSFGPDTSQGFYGDNSREFFALPKTVGISINRSF
jgi:outer membrane receptor protein involved in Fe transport